MKLRTTRRQVGCAHEGVAMAAVILAIVALVTEALVTALERRLLRWRPSTVSEATI